MLPIATLSYVIRINGELVACEETRSEPGRIIGARRSADGLSRHSFEAILDSDQRVCKVTLSYAGGLFTRKATYEAVQDDLRGRISGLSGRNEVAIKLGRFREVDAAGFLIFRALIIAHVRLRDQERWTGRVAVIDQNSLMAMSLKQTCMRQNSSKRCWIYQPRMGESEQIELDEDGLIVRWLDHRGAAAELLASSAA